MAACNAAPSRRSSQLRALLETGCEWFRRRHPTLWLGRPAHSAARQQGGSCTFHLCRRMIAHSQAKQFVAYLLLGQGPTRETILYAAILPRLLYDCPYSRPYNARTEKSPCPSGQLPPKEKRPACSKPLRLAPQRSVTDRSGQSLHRTTPASARPPLFRVSLGFPSLPSWGCDRRYDAVAAANRRPQTLSFLSALLPTACRQAFRIYRIVLPGRDFWRLKFPPRQYTCTEENRLFTGPRDLHRCQEIQTQAAPEMFPELTNDSGEQYCIQHSMIAVCVNSIPPAKPNPAIRNTSEAVLLAAGRSRFDYIIQNGPSSRLLLQTTGNTRAQCRATEYCGIHSRDYELDNPTLRAKLLNTCLNKSNFRRCFASESLR
jgi:hypothetical protein